MSGPSRARTQGQRSERASLVGRADWQLLTNQEADASELREAQVFVWQRSGARGPDPRTDSVPGGRKKRA